jgi:DNA-binding transcriptional LysR family regulator
MKRPDVGQEHAPDPGDVFRLGSLENLAALQLPVPLARYHKQHPAVSIELGAALVPQSLVASFPGRAALSEHALPASEILLASLVWRKPRASVRVRALLEVLSAHASAISRPKKSQV